MISKKLNYLFSLFIFLSGIPITLAGDSCYPSFDPSQSQFIIGYGSLISTESKLKTDPDAGESIPVEVNGFKRGFFARGNRFKFSSTFLGVIHERNSRFNGVVFQLHPPTNITNYDERENSYCRQEVNRNDIQTLAQNHLDPGQYWIYVQKNGTITPATKELPIIQSYVDVFLSGCLEIEKKFNLPNFAKECIIYTSEWSSYWVNDRIFPRRPTAYQPNATKIDNLLIETVPNQFNEIKIEG